MKEKKLNIVKFFSVSLLIVLLMYILNSLTPMHFDDFIYVNSFATKERITSISQIFPSMAAHYQTYNGRLLVHFLAQVFLLMNEHLFDALNAVAFLALILVVYYHAVGTFKNPDARLLLIIFFIFWFSTPAFGHSFLWLVGSANYLYGILIALTCLIPYRFYFGEYKKLSTVKKHTSVAARADMRCCRSIYKRKSFGDRYCHTGTLHHSIHY